MKWPTKEQTGRGLVSEAVDTERQRLCDEVDNFLMTKTGLHIVVIVDFIADLRKGPKL